jgi:hypothetical protein
MMEPKMKSEEPLAMQLRRGRRRKYDKQPLLDRIHELLAERNENYREASLRAHLDNASIQRIISGQRPSMTTCAYLADHFGVNPNEFLELAFWPRLSLFDVAKNMPEKLPNDVLEVATRLAQIDNPGTRKKVTEAIMTLLNQYFE